MKITKLVALSIVGLSIVSCGTKEKKEVTLTSKLDSVSYALGLTSATQGKMIKEGLKNDFSLTLNQPAYLQGFNNAVDSSNFKINIEKSRDLLNKFIADQRELAQKRKETNAEAAVLPISEGDDLKTILDSVSYALGVKSGSEIKFMKNTLKTRFDVDMQTPIFVVAYENGMDSDSLNIKITEEKSKELLKNFFEAKQAKQHEENKKVGEDFLAKNKENPNVKTTESGLQYEVVKEGKGKNPTSESQVKVHYHGTLIDGTVFDSSLKAEPVTFPLNQVIAGWTEGIQLMKEGAKYKFYIPQELAYGAKPGSPVIKPFSALIFEVELIKVSEVVPAPAPTPKKEK